MVSVYIVYRMHKVERTRGSVMCRYLTANDFIYDQMNTLYNNNSLKKISTICSLRFPDYTSMVNAGFILPNEAARLAYIDNHTAYETTWTPILWAVNLLQRERVAGRITIEAPTYARLIEAFDYIDNCNRQIFNHGWVNFPLGI